MTREKEKKSVSRDEVKALETMAESGSLVDLKEEEIAPKESKPVTVRRNTLITYYNRMNPQTNYLLKVQISRLKLKIQREIGIRHIRGKLKVEKDEEEPTIIRIIPFFPGCLVVQGTKNCSLKNTCRGKRSSRYKGGCGSWNRLYGNPSSIGTIQYQYFQHVKFNLDRSFNRAPDASRACIAHDDTTDLGHHSNSIDHLPCFGRLFLCKKKAGSKGTGGKHLNEHVKILKHIDFFFNIALPCKHYVWQVSFHKRCTAWIHP